MKLDIFLMLLNCFFGLAGAFFPEPLNYLFLLGQAFALWAQVRNGNEQERFRQMRQEADDKLEEQHCA